jgi:hypothetical protein
MKTLPTRLSLLAVAVLVSAIPAFSQNVVYSEGFESGLGDWTATGLWNLEDSSDSCGVLAAPYPEGTKCAWYGTTPSCNYDTGIANSGTLTKNDWIQLPVATSISLHWWMWIHSEYCFIDTYSNQYDQFSVVITRQTGGSITQQQCGGHTGPAVQIPWHERQIDISAYSGALVKIQFAFGTGDQLSNGYLGWLVDNVSIVAEPGTRVCPTGALTSGCPCVPSLQPVAGGCRNSTGQSATLFSAGTPSVLADSIQLVAKEMPPGTSGTCFQGTALFAPPAVYGDGLLCVTGTLLRLGTQFAPTGDIDWPIPAIGSISVAGGVSPSGATHYYQVVYRDSPSFCTPATFNVTSAERLIWVP